MKKPVEIDEEKIPRDADPFDVQEEEVDDGFDTGMCICHLLSMLLDETKEIKKLLEKLV